MKAGPATATRDGAGRASGMARAAHAPAVAAPATPQPNAHWQALSLASARAPLAAASGAGEPLPQDVPARLGMAHDFRHVRVHTDAAAAQAARALKARAFADGSHLVFGAGQFRPGTPAGDRLLAHELTHVVQHDEGRLRGPAAAPLALSQDGDAVEAEARDAEARAAPRAAGSTAAGGPPPTPSHGAVIARDPDPAAAGAGTGTGAGSHAMQLPSSVVEDEVVELRGASRFKPSAALAEAIDAVGDAGLMVRVRYGTVAEGRIRVWRHPEGYFETVFANRPTARWPIHLHHPGLLAETGPVPADPTHSSESVLAVRISHGEVEGIVAAVPVPAILNGTLEGDNWAATGPAARLLGWRGLQNLDLPTLVNQLRGGVLRYQAPGFRFGLDSAFEGRGDFSITDLGWRFEARAQLHVEGLADAQLAIHRDPQGHVFGDAHMQARLRGFSGQLDAVFGQGLLDIRGVVRYSRAPTLRGELGLHVTDLETARDAASARIAAARPVAGAGAPLIGPPRPPAASAASASALPAAGARRPRGVTGWGVLDYHFNRWLTGRAEVIVSPEGHVTSVAEIRPTAEVPFLDPAVQRKTTLVPRQSFHVPVFSVLVADLGFGGSAQIDAQGAIGPGRLHGMAASGMFSTDPDIPVELDITAMMSLSAIAKLLLHIRGDVGVFVAGRSLGSARVNITGDATLRAHLDVQPRIQRRPDPAGAAGASQWALEGMLRAGADLSVGLKGSIDLHALLWDLHVIDLGSKRWNLGSVGIQADVSYVIGSSQRPQLSYGAIDFPAERFMAAVLNEQPLPGDMPAEADAARPGWEPEGPGPAELPATAGEAAVAPPASAAPSAAPSATPPALPAAGAAPAAGAPADAGTPPADAGQTPSPDAGAGSGGAPGTGSGPAPGATVPPQAQVPQPVVAHPVMEGTTHTLTLTAETTPVLVFESDPGLLTAKIRRRIQELKQSGPPARGSRLAAQVVALQELGDQAEEVEREAIALETGWKQQGRRPPSDWRIPRSVPGFDSLVGSIGMYAAQFNETDILPYAPDVAGSREVTVDDLRPRGDGRVLLLGEADFSFGVALLRQLQGGGAIVATEVRSQAEVDTTYRGGGRPSAAANVRTLQQAQVDVQFGVDATNIPASLGRFQVIVFNFPRMPEDSRGGTANNTAMLDGFFRSAHDRLAPDGRVFLSLSTSRYVNLWQPQERARNAGLALESIRAAFHERNFPGYRHQMTHEEGPAGSRDSDYPGLTFVFRLR